MIAALRAFASALGLLPGWAWALICAAALSAYFTTSSNLKSEREAHANTRATYAQHVAELALKAQAAEARYRKTEGELAARILEDTHATQARLDEAAAALAAAHTDGARLRSAEQRLRDQLAALTAASCGSAIAAATASDGQAAQDARNLLANVRERLDAATEGIAGFADAASSAGAACERAYDRAQGALTPKD